MSWGDTDRLYSLLESLERILDQAQVDGGMTPEILLVQELVNETNAEIKEALDEEDR